MEHHEVNSITSATIFLGYILFNKLNSASKNIKNIVKYL